MKIFEVSLIKCNSLKLTCNSPKDSELESNKVLVILYHCENFTKILVGFKVVY